MLPSQAYVWYDDELQVVEGDPYTDDGAKQFNIKKVNTKNNLITFLSLDKPNIVKYYPIINHKSNLRLLTS